MAHKQISFALFTAHITYVNKKISRVRNLSCVRILKLAWPYIQILLKL